MIPALGRLGQEDQEFKASLGYSKSDPLSNKNKHNQHNNN